MGSPNSPDEASFDINAFEAAAIGRARTLTSQVDRLAVHPDEQDCNDWLVQRGAQYELADGTYIGVRHETWDQDPEKIIAKVRIKHPYAESLGADRNLRRVQLTRFVLYQSFIDVPGKEILESLEKELPHNPEVDEQLNRVWENRLRRIERNRLERQLQPDYRPSELIRACTHATVECKMGRTPNFRTEHYRENMPPDTKLAHLAARRHAGERVEALEYSVAEHSGIIAMLDSLDPVVCMPGPLSADFDTEWLDPDPPKNPWWPRSLPQDPT